MTEIHEYGAWQAAEQMAAGALTSEAFTRACLERIAAIDRDHNAWVHLAPDAALAAARQRDREPRRVRGSPASESPVHPWNGGACASGGQFCGAHSLTTQPDGVGVTCA